VKPALPKPTCLIALREDGNRLWTWGAPNPVDPPYTSHAYESCRDHWSLGAYSGGLLVWENLEAGEPRHMNGVSRDRVLALWLKLADGRLDEIEAEPWLPGYEDAKPDSANKGGR
jgi:hypothetical protein